LLWYFIGRSVTVEVPVPAWSRQWLRIFICIKIFVVENCELKKPAELEHGGERTVRI